MGAALAKYAFAAGSAWLVATEAGQTVNALLAPVVRAFGAF